MTDAPVLDRPKFTRDNSPAQLSRGYNGVANNVAHQIGPHSRPHTLARVDGRTRQAAVLNRVRNQLTEHIGNPNIVEKMMIERCAWLAVRLAMLDRKIESGKDLTLVDSNTYLAWHNSFVRTLSRLGIRPVNADNGTYKAVLAELNGDAHPR